MSVEAFATSFHITADIICIYSRCINASSSTRMCPNLGPLRSQTFFIFTPFEVISFHTRTCPSGKSGPKYVHLNLLVFLISLDPGTSGHAPPSIFHSQLIHNLHRPLQLPQPSPNPPLYLLASLPSHCLMERRFQLI